MTRAPTRRDALAAGTALLAAPATAERPAERVGIAAVATALNAGPVPPGAAAVRTEGYREPGDGGGGLYRRVASSPASGGFRSADGACWALACDTPSVRQFGAVGDGHADDRAAIQAAIDWSAAAGGGTVLLPVGRFRLTLAPAPDGRGFIGLWLRSGVRLEGMDPRRSVLVVADRQRGQGTFARVIGSGDLSDAALIGFTLDGNRAGQGAEHDATNGGAVLLGTGSARLERVAVERLTVTGANGQGIQLVGRPDLPARDLRVRGNRVTGASFIGIQVSQFRGLVIDDNDVADCRDNAIDIYGEDDRAPSDAVTGRDARITGNRLRRCSVGVFLETVADVDVVGNTVDACRKTGIHLNRIHGAPTGIAISGNRVADTPIGVSITGDTGGVSITGNHIARFSAAGLQFGLDGAGNVSLVAATGNVFDCRALTGPIVHGSVPGGVLAWITVRDNIVYGLPPPDRLFVNRYGTNRRVEVGGFIGLQGDLKMAVVVEPWPIVHDPSASGTVSRDRG